MSGLDWAVYVQGQIDEEKQEAKYCCSVYSSTTIRALVYVVSKDVSI